MRTLIVVFPEKFFGENIDEERTAAIYDEFTNRLKFYAPGYEPFIVVGKINKPEFYIIPSRKDELDKNKMIPIENLKDVAEMLKKENLI